MPEPRDRKRPASGAGRDGRPDAAEPQLDEAAGRVASEKERLEEEAGPPPEDAPVAGEPEERESVEAAEADEPEERGDAAEPAEPEDELTAALRERGEYLELAQRTQADFENFRRRAAREAAAAGERAKIGLLREFLPVLDNLERALAAAPDKDDGLAKGVRLVLDELVGVFERSGIEAIEPEGDAFDPTLHEALSTRSEDGAKPGVVLEVVEKGYKLNDTVIRPARVVVSA